MSSGAFTDSIGHDSTSTWSTAQVGMLAFLCSEAAFFATLLIGYLTYAGVEMAGPTPKSLSLPLAITNTVFLLLSSVTIVLSLKSQSRTDRSGFTLWMLVTAGLGMSFLVGTGFEWYRLIYHDGLTISRNLFGTTFFTLVGFHATHVTVGILAMIVLVIRRSKGWMAVDSEAPELVSWYWHLVDGVWLLILVLVYLMGR
ncbi:MAG: cytochrome o ubiquinol oxidase subunit III [Gemmatales bacterium]|nr:MAG: cytochrome o ubiquinol oxidase subunit III [Gemmatales bacterium]